MNEIMLGYLVKITPDSLRPGKIVEVILPEYCGVIFMSLSKAGSYLHVTS